MFVHCFRLISKKAFGYLRKNVVPIPSLLALRKYQREHGITNHHNHNRTGSNLKDTSKKKQPKKFDIPKPCDYCCSEFINPGKLKKHIFKCSKISKSMQIKQEPVKHVKEISKNDFQADTSITDFDGSVTMKEETNNYLIPIKLEINPEDFQFQNESVVLFANDDGTMNIKEEENE